MQLLVLIDEHRGAFEYDWASRFHEPLLLDDCRQVARAWLLTDQLAKDPSSHVYAALAGWSHPMSREALVMADLVDLFTAANSARGRKPKPYPRPWKHAVTDGRAMGQGTSMSVTEYRALRERLAEEVERG